MSAKVEIFKCHEDRLHFIVTGEPGDDWKEMKRAAMFELDDLTAEPRRMSLDKQNARAFAACERAYLEAPE